MPGVPGKVVTLIAAHNEERVISAALASLANQTRRPDRVIVVADRCTDRTAAIALAAGVEVFATVNNRDRKAGALNQALSSVLPGLGAADMVLMMDADTILSPGFLRTAESRLQAQDDGRSEVGAVGAVFLADEPARNFVEKLQRNEYLRYAHDLARRRARAEVISGTAGLFPAGVLRHVVAERGGALPEARFVYDNRAWTEDNELTTAIKSLGYRCASPTGCTVQTEIMPNMRSLYYQRLRWQRGALDTLRTYGVNATTLPYILRQVLIHLGILFTPFFVAVLVIVTLDEGRFPWSWPWFALSAIVPFERVWTVRRGGRASVGTAAAVLPEVVYDLFLHVVFIRALIESLTGADAHWDHAQASQAPARGMAPRIARVGGQIVIPVVFIGMAVLAAAVATQAGVHWVVVGVMVGAGIAHSALRATMLDPVGLILGSSEPPSIHAAAPVRPRFVRSRPGLASSASPSGSA